MTSNRDADEHAELPGYRPRRIDRVPLAGAGASLQPQDLYAVEVKVKNLSPAGFMAECAEPVLIGSWVRLDIPGVGPVRAQVRWQLGRKMGGMFMDPISLAGCEWTAEKAEAA